MAMEVLKIFCTKVLYFAMLYELTKNERYLSSFSGSAKTLSVGLSDQYNSFFISVTVEELFVINQENPYVRFN